MSTARTARRRTLWEEGRQPGRRVTRVATLLALGLVALDLGVSSGLGWVFDIGFVLVCVAAALLVRPRDFFQVGVMPPLLMALVIAVLALAARGSVADERDGLVQALVSGLAHHAGALVVGYALTLALLALRQVALRNAGTLRSSHRGHARSVAGSGRRPSASAHRPAAGSAHRPAHATSRGRATGGGPAPSAEEAEPVRRTAGARVPAQAGPVDEARRSASGR